MRWGQLLLCGWPGLSRLWLRGHGPSLLVAVGFSILLNLALVSTFLWPALLGEAFPALAWPVLGLIWLVSLAISLRMTPTWAALPEMAAVQERDEFAGKRESRNERQQNLENEQNQQKEMELASHELESKSVQPNEQWDEVFEAPSRTLFIQAQTEYLKGHWKEAETLLQGLIHNEQRDVEARLLLSTLYRRTQQFERSLEELKQLEKFDEAAHWELEIDRERQIILREQSDEIGVNPLAESDETKHNTTIQQDPRPEDEQQPDEHELTDSDPNESKNVWLC